MSGHKTGKMLKTFVCCMGYSSMESPICTVAVLLIQRSSGMTNKDFQRIVGPGKKTYAASDKFNMNHVHRNVDSPLSCFTISIIHV